MNDIDDLKAAITSYLYDRKDLASSIATFIDVADRKIHRLLRIAANERTATLQVSGAEATLPTDYIETKLLTYGSIPLSRISDAEYQRRTLKNPSSSTPTAFTRRGDKLLIHPTPASPEDSETLLVYWADYSGELAQYNESPIFDIAPDLYLHGSLIEASAFLGQDSRIGVWKSAYQETLRDLQAQSEDEEFSGPGLAVMNQAGGHYSGY